MVPIEVYAIPMLLGIIKVGWANTYQALILPSIGNVFSVLIFRQFFLNFPRDLEDAARIDGAGHGLIFWKIALPLAQGAAHRRHRHHLRAQLEQFPVAAARRVRGRHEDAARRHRRLHAGLRHRDPARRLCAVHGRRHHPVRAERSHLPHPSALLHSGHLQRSDTWLVRIYSNFIDNGWAKPSSSGYFDTIDPATEEPIARLCPVDTADVDRGGPGGASRHVWRMARADAGRARPLMFRLADLIAADSRRLARLETLDVGKPLKDSLGDIDGVVTTLRYNAGAADKMEGSTIPLGLGVIDFTLLEPLGVTAHIVPWNFPLGMAMRSLAPALAAGCTCVLKPAEQSPLSAWPLPN